MNHCPVARVRERELGDGQRNNRRMEVVRRIMSTIIPADDGRFWRMLEQRLDNCAARYS